MNIEKLLFYIGLTSLVLAAILGWSLVALGYNNYTVDKNSYCVPLFEDVMEYCILNGKTLSCHANPVNQQECRIMDEIISNASNN